MTTKKMTVKKKEGSLDTVLSTAVQHSKYTVKGTTGTTTRKK